MTSAGRIESAALEWVSRRFEQFRPTSHASAKRIAYVTKAAAELAMICAVARKHARSSALYRQLAERVWEDIFRVETLQDYMLSNPDQVPCIGFYASLRSCGFEDHAYRRRLTTILKSGYLNAVERTPSTELDFAYSLAEADFVYRDMGKIYRRSMLGQHPLTYALTKADLYTITHSIFFTTDFGRRDPPFFTTDDRGYFASALPRLTGYSIRVGDWDLGAELLIALAAVRVDTPVVVAAWKMLMAAQKDDGSFNGPLDAEQASESAANPDREWVTFRDDYHTTLAVLLAIVCAPPTV
jgi:hypothetical protein